MQVGDLACKTRTATPCSTRSLTSRPTAGGDQRASGHWDYTPAADYNGTDSFTAGATDGALSSNAATIDVTIIP